MPAAIARWRSLSSAWAVSATIGKWRNWPACCRARSRRVASRPSITGICRSISTSAGAWRAQASSACAPSSAVCETTPSACRKPSPIMRLTGLSSTSSTWLPGADSAGAGSGGVPKGAAASATTGAGRGAGRSSASSARGVSGRWAEVMCSACAACSMSARCQSGRSSIDRCASGSACRSACRSAGLLSAHCEISTATGRSSAGSCSARSAASARLVGCCTSRARRSSCCSIQVTRPGSVATIQTGPSGGGGSGSSGPSVRRVSVSVNTEPAPGWLRSVMSPPRPTASARAVARPRPVPPCRRDRLASPCTKASNTCACCSGAMPGPVSSTCMRMRHVPSPSSTTSVITPTWPSSVNFSALPSRFTRMWRSRAGSPRTRVRRPSQSKCTATWRPRASGIRLRVVTASSSGRSMASSAGGWPPCAREKSSTSSTTCSSDRPDCSATSRCRRWVGELAICSASSVRPSTPLSGVRISWLMCATNSDLAAVARSAASRACWASARAASRLAVRWATRRSSSARSRSSAWRARTCSSTSISTPVTRTRPSACTCGVAIW